MTQATLLELAQLWDLAEQEAACLEKAGPSSLAPCLDIDRSLLWLLGERETVRRWLKTPHRVLYHRTPLNLVIGSSSGRQLIRQVLLIEAADACEMEAQAAMRAS